MRSSSLFILILFVGLVQTACQRGERNSVIVIAVDDLPVSDVSCARENSNESKSSGLDLLCRESVRFTHAFSPSPLAAPAVASMLTGLYPFQHQLRHNGGFLPARFQTAAEIAVGLRYRTGFFSGGAPVLRKTGLNQGFEVFDDSIVPDITSFTRPFSKSVAQYEQWLRQEVGGASFFAFFYVPDLIFTNTETASDIGELRNFSYESQLEEFNEGLSRLIEILKKTNRWDQTTLVLAGLNGHTGSDRPGEASTLNLHSENTQVLLLVKPAQRKRDLGINWKVDKNVSLVDVGRTLLDLLQGNPGGEANGDFPVESLKPLLTNAESALAEDRLILLESAWGEWRGLSNLRTALIQNHVLYLNDVEPKAYNTLVDRLETNPLGENERKRLVTGALQETLNRNQFSPWQGLDPLWVNKLGVPYDHWTNSISASRLVRDLKKILAKAPSDRETTQWLAQVALETRDWKTLHELGDTAAIPLWVYVSEKNTGGVRTHFSDPCLDLLREKNLEPRMTKNCGDNLFLDFLDWRRADARGLSRDLQQKKFERAYRNHVIQKNMWRTNLSLDLIWDMNMETPYAPSSLDMILSLPEMQKVRAQLEKRIRAKAEDEII